MRDSQGPGVCFGLDIIEFGDVCKAKCYSTVRVRLEVCSNRGVWGLFSAWDGVWTLKAACRWDLIDRPSRMQIVGRCCGFLDDGNLTYLALIVCVLHFTNHDEVYEHLRDSDFHPLLPADHVSFLRLCCWRRETWQGRAGHSMVFASL